MRSVFNELADEHGFRKVLPAEYNRFRDLHGTALLKALELPLWKLPRVVTGMRRKMALHVEKFSLFAGIDRVLHQLSAAGIRLAIVSSNSRVNVERILGQQNTKLITHFGCEVSMFGKAAKLRSAVRTSGVPSSESIYVGDEIRDAEAARKAGVAFGAVVWGQHSANVLRAQNPAEVFGAVQEIADKLCRIT